MKRRSIKYIWDTSAGQRRRICAAACVGLADVAVSLGFIWASKRVVDVAVGDAAGNLPRVAALAVVLLALQLLATAANAWLIARMQVEAGNGLRRHLFRRLLHSRWNEAEQYHTGDLMNRISQDVASIVTLLTATLPGAIVTGVQLVAAFVFFCCLDPLLPWIVTGMVPLFLMGSRCYTRRMRSLTHSIRRSDSHIQSVIQEGLQHRAVIKTLEQAPLQLGRLDSLQGTLARQVMHRTRFSLGARLLVAATFSGGYLTVFLWGAAALSTGSIGFGTMTAFLQLVGKVQRPVLDLARLIPSAVAALTAADRLQELESLPAEAQEEPLRFASTPDVELHHVTFGYAPASRPVLTDFSFRFRAGTSTAVMGATGRGKTTLVRLLLALVQPVAGQVLLCGRTDAAPDTTEKKEVEASAATRCNFVYVPQGNTLFSGSIRDNLLMGNPTATEEQMIQALRTAAADFVLTLPQGIDTLLTEQAGGLSEGQAQRIALARALLRPGTILLLDEATSALDAETERRVMDNLRRQCCGKTLIFITHHRALAALCDDVVEL